MKNLLLNHGQIFVWLLAITELIIGIIALFQSKKNLNILIFAVCFGLFIDAAIMGLGSIIGVGNFLHNLSQIRYILHGVLVPLLIPIAFYSYGIENKTAKIVLWSVTGAVILLGVVMGFMIKTEPVIEGGVLRYATSADSPRIAVIVENALSFGGVIPLLIIGLIHLIIHKSPFLFLSGLFMFAFSAIAPATGNMNLNFLTTMFGEDFMVLFFLLEMIKKK